MNLCAALVARERWLMKPYVYVLCNRRQGCDPGTFCGTPCGGDFQNHSVDYSAAALFFPQTFYFFLLPSGIPPKVSFICCPYKNKNYFSFLYGHTREYSNKYYTSSFSSTSVRTASPEPSFSYTTSMFGKCKTFIL